MVSQSTARGVENQDVFLELPRKLNFAAGAAPRIDAHEADGMIEMTAEIPGVPESAIDVTINGDVLTICVEKPDPNAGRRVFFTERSFGRFERSIQLPFAPDPQRVEATVENGLLTIRFPRIERARDRTHHVPLNGASRPAPPPEEDPSDFVAAWPEPAATIKEPLTVEATATRLS